MQTLEQIARFVRSHDMPMVRIVGDAVEFASDVIMADGAHWQELTKVRSLREARDALGY